MLHEPEGCRALVELRCRVCAHVHGASAVFDQQPDGRDPRIRKRREMGIVKEYSDEGKSGLNIQGRDSLAQMIRDVQEGKAHYSSILVYDVSRWGRFQDADESAYYEYICRRAGVSVHYCAEQFENDGSPMSTVMKSMKRTMAGEYSRELSTKVFQGACRLIQLGYKQGGTAGFGLRRMLIDQSGERKAMLKMGEQKSIQTDRVVLVRGPEEEIKIVRWIFQTFIGEGKIRIGNCDHPECARREDGFWAGMEPGDGASNPHE
jgi:DNA invertase Pin-like site-specific DNA recombinase